MAIPLQESHLENVVIFIEPKDTIEFLDYIQHFDDVIPQINAIIPIIPYEFNEFLNEGIEIYISMNHDPECYDPRINISVNLYTYPEDYYDRIRKIREYIPQTQFQKGDVFLTCNYNKPILLPSVQLVKKI